jgi:hypothetical protein
MRERRSKFGARRQRPDHHILGSGPVEAHRHGDEAADRWCGREFPTEPRPQPAQASRPRLSLQRHGDAQRWKNDDATCCRGRRGQILYYFTRILRLSFLAPDIVKVILRDRHPIELSAKRLANELHLPITWDEQRALLGSG